MSIAAYALEIQERKEPCSSECTEIRLAAKLLNSLVSCNLESKRESPCLIQHYGVLWERLNKVSCPGVVLVAARINMPVLVFIVGKHALHDESIGGGMPMRIGWNWECGWRCGP